MKRSSLALLLPLVPACVDASRSTQEPGSQKPLGLAVLVDTEDDPHPISPRIYGVNPHSGHACDDADVRYGSCRLGGNRWTAYNWENNLSNAGRDYCFQNDEHLGSPDDPPGSAATYVLEQAARVGAAAMLTVPIVDLVAGEATGGSGPPGCSGDVRAIADFETAVMRRNEPVSGDPDGAFDPDDAVVYQDQFVALVRDRAAEIRDAEVVFSLDNEPDLWADTHPEVHPERVGYRELVERSVDYGLAIKNTWPEAEVAGFASYGYQGYLSLQGAEDAEGRFVDYFLREMARAEEEHGVRLIDYLDVHWYPEISPENEDGEARRLTTADSFPEMVQERVQAARSLWDPNYVESSWVGSVAGAVRLIPWLSDIVAEQYPGTKLAITEWYYGGGNHISGAIAHADALGAFGRHGVELATLWPHTPDDAFVKAAFRVYRNYDGEGAAFGDTSVGARTTDDEVLAAYASLTRADELVLVVINRSDAAEEVELDVEHTATLTPSRAFTLTETGPDLRESDLPDRVGRNHFRSEFSAYSVSVLEFAP